MLGCANSHNVRLVCALRNYSTFNRNRKYYELTIDQEEKDIQNRPNPLADIEQRIKQSKQKLVWRLPPEKPYSLSQDVLGMFSDERKRAAHLQRIVQPMKFSATLKELMAERDERRREFEALMQCFIPQRHEILGNNLAAAHFLIHRGAKVRFTKSPNWVSKNEDDEYDLPSRYNPNWIIDGINCDGMELYYEGLANIRRLYELKTFSLRNIKHFDDWCLDRLAGNQFDNLEVLDISGTGITANGLTALPKIPSLKVLILSDTKRSTAFELSLLMLEEVIPNLEIREAENTSPHAPPPE